MEGPPILKDEVLEAIKKMKRGKAVGPDDIPVEIFDAIDDFGISFFTEFLNTIYDTGKIPNDMSKSIFVTIPKKTGATECELHRTISLMNHVLKILLKTSMIGAPPLIIPINKSGLNPLS